MKTFVPKPSEHKRKWYLVDANGKTLGRMATEIAKRIRGKDNPLFTPYYDMGASVVVINADKVRLTGKKESIKTYTWHTAYPRGLRSVSFKKQLARQPEKVIQEAVRGMLPRNRLGRKLFLRLFVYAGDKHPHTSQNPQPLEI
ncbi:MAG: 50S ribosomal protein L13 [candidate division Zixibacteria bacterium]|jgi:large subunit ribosomal protein L13|nr:50S ribosomal protein L13 [candidate division Zixibacteria bacterium]